MSTTNSSSQGAESVGSAPPPPLVSLLSEGAEGRPDADDPAPSSPTSKSSPHTAGAVQAAPVLGPPPAQTRIEGDKLLRRIAEHELQLQRIARDAEEHMAEISSWAKSEAAQHERAIAELKARIEPFARAEVARDPLHRKRAVFPAGVAGWRSPAARLVVDDEDAFAEWATTYRPGWVKVTIEPRVVVAKKEGIQDGERLKADIEFGDGDAVREIVPGCHFEGGPDVFFVTTGAGGRR